MIKWKQCDFIMNLTHLYKTLLLCYKTSILGGNYEGYTKVYKRKNSVYN